MSGSRRMEKGFKRDLNRSVKGGVFFDRSLKNYTTFKIGGAVRVWVEPDGEEDLIRALRILSKEEIKPFLIGKGSNVLAYDGKIDRAVVRLSAPSFRNVKFAKDSVICGAGLSLSSLISRSAGRGLSGLERFAGIPGTVGGAIMMNAGSGSYSIGRLIKRVKVIDYKGRGPRILKKRDLIFNYRDSGLSRYVILEAEFTLKKRKREAIRRDYRRILKKKTASQEYKLPNAGCVFKNPMGLKLTSGEAIERSGLKGVRIGGAEVSAKHANFIVNRGGATFSDVASLMELTKKVVKENLGISLKPEIKIIR